MEASMSVGLIGNMNNNHFVLARYLRDAGIDAHLILTCDEFSHFHPSADTFDLEYQQFTQQVSWGTQDDVRTLSPALLQKNLAPYDVLIGCGFAPAFCLKAGRALDVFIPYGSDLYDATRHYKWPHHYLRHRKAVSLQRRGIAESRVISMPPCPTMYESILDHLAPGVQRWERGIPLVYSPDYSQEKLGQNATRSHWKWRFDEIRADSDFLVFMTGRHVWDCPVSNPSHKGNDIFLRGLADFALRNPDTRIHVVMFEYGSDVMQTKDLAKQLKIDHAISWFPVLHRKEIMLGLNMADLLCGELTHSWIMGGASFEALSLGVPIMMYRDEDIKSGTSTGLYPILNVANSTEVADGLEWSLNSGDELKDMGLRGAQWYEDEVVVPSIAQFADYLSIR